MPTIFDDPENPTAITIMEWQNIVVDSLNSMNTYLTNMENMLVTMQNNTVDFTVDDCIEMENRIAYLQTIIDDYCEGEW